MEHSENGEPPNPLRAAISRMAPSASTIRLHKETLTGAPLPAPHAVKKPSFVHGLLLPISLIATALRQRSTRGRYLRLVGVRSLLIVLGALFLSSGDNVPKSRPRPQIELHSSTPVDTQLIPGVRLRIPVRDGGLAAAGFSMSTDGGIANADLAYRAHGELPSLGTPTSGADMKDVGAGDITVFGVRVPINEPLDGTGKTEAVGEKSTFWVWVTKSWARVLGFVGVLSFWEVVLVFFSRKWDDALSFDLSRAAGIVPEEAAPAPAKLSADVAWAWRKIKRKVRGTIVVVAGIPVLLPLKIIPGLGDILFTAFLTAWGWYWIGVFAASKSAHAWADAAVAEAPLPIRKVRGAIPRHSTFGLFRVYVRIWEWVMRETYPAVTTFERSPRAYLGLGLTRAVFSIPFLYLLMRPVLPVASGRICAESDPEGRFTLKEPSEPVAAAPSPIDSAPG